MGQTVEINHTVQIDDILVIDTDRSFTGQDGQTITPAAPGSAVPGRLAERLFDLEVGIDHVHVLQNVITLRRPGGWDEDLAGQAIDVAGSFLRHYDEEE
jgi:hypothetical protein